MMSISEIKPRIIVADDNASVLLTLVSALSTDFDVVGTAADGRSALTSIQHLQPCVAVLDLNMPELSGIEVAREILRLGLTCVVVICSVESDPELISAAQLAGVMGYVLKRRLNKDLVLAVKRAVGGEVFISSCEPARPRIVR
jgi:DNA-binding NarL/FixJ family response regulator